MTADFGPALDQLLGDVNRRRIPQVIRVRFERQSQQGHRLAFEDLQFVLNAHHNLFPQLVVDRAGCLDDRHIQIILTGCRDQRGCVLAKARTTPADAGIQETWANTCIQSNPARDLGDIRADLLGQVGDLIDIGNLQRQKRVGGIFNHLSRCQITGHQRHHRKTFRTRQTLGSGKILVQNRAVQIRQHINRARIRRSNDNPIRVKRIIQRGTLPQELWIRSNRIMLIGFHAMAFDISIAHNRPDPVARANRHRRLVHHHREVIVQP